MCINDLWAAGEPGPTINQVYAGMVPTGHSWGKGIHDGTDSDKMLAMCEYRCVKPNGSDNSAQNQCTCSNGNGATGTSCPTHNTEKCSDCNTGYKMENNVCIENVCNCGVGPPYTGAACPVDGAQGCESCYSGYHHDVRSSGDSCVENVCTCGNGPGHTGPACPVNGVRGCASCNSGYTHIKLSNGDICHPSSYLVPSVT